MLVTVCCRLMRWYRNKIKSAYNAEKMVPNLIAEMLNNTYQNCNIPKHLLLR